MQLSLVQVSAVTGPKRGAAVLAAVAILAGLPALALANVVPPAKPAEVRPAAETGDLRCFYGPGIQVWDEINKGGYTMILCGYRGKWSNLSGLGEQLGGWPHTWNDRISSFQTFNTHQGDADMQFRLCTAADFSGTCYYTYKAEYVANVGSTFNDQFSSIKDYPVYYAASSLTKLSAEGSSTWPS